MVIYLLGCLASWAAITGIDIANAYKKDTSKIDRAISLVICVLCSWLAVIALLFLKLEEIRLGLEVRNE